MQINTVCDFASTGRSTTELSNALINRGHECFIAYSKTTMHYENSYKVGRELGKKIHAMLSRIFGKQAYYSSWATKELLKYIDNIKPDIVQLGNLHSNFIHLGLLLEYLAKNDIATVITLHDCWFFTGKCVHYSADHCYRWQTGCGHCPRLHKDNTSYFFDRTHEMWKDKKRWFGKIKRLGVVGVSDWVTNQAKQSFLADKKIVRIYNWIDLETFKPHNTDEIKKTMGLNDKFVILGVASGWSDEKGLKAFIALSQMLDESYQIVLVGKMPSDITFAKNVRCIAHTNNIQELAQYYSMADVFVNPSIEETFGKVTAESLACGTPAIVYNSTACPELIGEGCGYVVEIGNITGIYKKIMEIRNNGKEFYSKSCVAFANENFEYEKNVDEYIKLYEELL